MDRRRLDPQRVLLVSSDRLMRDRIGGWLQEEGHEIFECPGPIAPDFTCIIGRGLPCPLERGADIVVLDLGLSDEVVLPATARSQLLDYYLVSGHPVVVIVAEEDSARFFPDEKVICLSRPVFKENLIDSICHLAARRSAAEIGTLRFPGNARGPFDGRARRALYLADRATRSPR